MILADTSKVAEAVIETLSGPAKMSVLLQQFVKESRGRDVRAFVVGDRVVAAMRRVAQGDEFRSNIHWGGASRARRARRGTPLLLGSHALGQPVGGGGISRRQSRVTSSMS